MARLTRNLHAVKDSSVCIGKYWTAGIQFTAMQDSFSRHVVTGSGDPPSLFSSGYEWPRREGDHSPPSRVEIKNGGAKPLLRHVYLWYSAL
jgi:hypothetical protein